MAPPPRRKNKTGGGEANRSGTRYALKQVTGVPQRDDGTIRAVADAAAAVIEGALKPHLAIPDELRTQSGLLGRPGAGGPSFRWSATISNKPAAWHYWTELRFALEITELTTRKTHHGMILVFEKKIDEQGKKKLGELGLRMVGVPVWLRGLWRE